jgi:putative photosynthetic complex assembly protein
MSDHHATRPFPRHTLIIIGSVMLMTILFAAAGRIHGYSYNTPTAAPVTSRDLLFRDRQDGAVVVYDARSMAEPIEVLAPGSNYFVRATMRGLARQRLRQDADRDVPFRLTEWADGRLTLEDPTTGRRVEMEAFGIDNEKPFAAMLTAHAGSDGAGS